MKEVWKEIVAGMTQKFFFWTWLALLTLLLTIVICTGCNKQIQDDAVQLEKDLMQYKYSDKPQEKSAP